MTVIKPLFTPAGTQGGGVKYSQGVGYLVCKQLIIWRYQNVPSYQGKTARILDMNNLLIRNEKFLFQSKTKNGQKISLVRLLSYEHSTQLFVMDEICCN